MIISRTQPQEHGSLAPLMDQWQVILAATTSQAAAHQYFNAARRFVWANQIDRPGQITAGVVQLYLAQARQDRGLAPATLHHLRTAISSLCDYCCQQGQLHENPCAAVKVPKIPRRPIRWLDAAATRRAVLLAGYYGCGFEVKMAIYTGLRRDELRRLKWERVDLAAKLVRVEYGKGGKHRTVPLSAAIYDDLAAVALPDGWVFPGRMGQCRSKSTWGNLINPVRERMPEVTGWHIFRKTFASLLMQAGVSPAKIAAWLGHSDIKLTLSTYGSLAPDRYDADIDRLNPTDCP